MTIDIFLSIVKMTFMDTEKILLTVQLWHPFLSADEIIKQIQKEPKVTQNIRENFVTPKGRIMDHVNKETYIAYRLSPANEDDLVDAIRMANSFLFENIDIFNKIKETGGKINYYLSIDQKDLATFIIPPELFKDCSELGITLSVEIYP
jgi:hypothetical protein